MSYDQLSNLYSDQNKDNQLSNLHFYAESVAFSDYFDSNCGTSIPLGKIEEHIQAHPRQMLDDLLTRISQSDLPGKDYFSEHLTSKYRRNLKPNTLKATFQSLNLFLSFYQQMNKAHLELITRKDLEAFVEHEQDQGLKPSTVDTRLRQVYAFLRFLVELKVVDYEMLERKIRIKRPNMLPRAIPPEDIKDILSVIDKTRDRAMILLLLRTGMRIGELLDTKVNDIDLKEQKILIHQASKTYLGRVVYFSDDAHEALENWIKERDSNKAVLFYGRRGKSLSYEAARIVFRKYLEKTGLLAKSYTLHCLRHTYASELLNAGMRLEYLQVLLGHTNIEITRHYARLTDTAREEEYFRAMKIILRGEINGHYQLDC